MAAALTPRKEPPKRPSRHFRGVLWWQCHFSNQPSVPPHPFGTAMAVQRAFDGGNVVSDPDLFLPECK